MKQCFFFYYPVKSEEKQWAIKEWDLMTGIHCCACFKPNERWVFISDPGEVFVIGQGDKGEESPIQTTSKNHFKTVKCIAGGYAYAAGVNRKIFKRIDKNTWQPMHSTEMIEKKRMPEYLMGFRDIDGFSDNEIYACGGDGDLWLYGGQKWQQINSPTNVSLEKICCASNGMVYITTNRDLLLFGRGDKWELQDIDTNGHRLKEIVCYNDRVFVSSRKQLFEIENNRLIKTKMDIPKMDGYSHLAAGDGILVVGGTHSAQFYDGQKWNEIYDFSKSKF